ncbi:hypothetical protein LSUB1_G003957 [Lachnellula subtilissima]|uniref:Aminoglycoside phosphotransferase domain-containing protein n=1 Tax=Lachnellula subtilissima TaxID=602034 RepID=A0A8H8RQV7_9HELO|nr:hypothetical protein LSUB1_G003957 [Lachnellula subtilissima]
MTALLKLPYFRDSKDLPAPLPTKSEILASTNILKGNEPWAFRKVVVVNEVLIAKYGQAKGQIEGENLLFFEENKFRGVAPRLYAMWKEDDGIQFIIMERLGGEMLEKLWPALEEADKTRLLAKTRELLSRIRELPHQGFFGAVDGTHLSHHLFYWSKYPAHVSGPFSNEVDLIKGFAAKSRLNAEDNDRISYVADFCEEQLMGSLAVVGRAPVFTHCDLQRKNILVEVVEGTAENEKDFRVSLVDWESAGWYPVYWEYFVAFISLKWDDDWCSKFVQAVDAWPAEAAMMKIVYQDLWL